MDPIQLIINTLKAFIERMKSIFSLIISDFFPNDIETTTRPELPDFIFPDHHYDD